MGTETATVANTLISLAGALISILLAIVAFFLNRLFKQIHVNTSQSYKIQTDVALMQKDIAVFQELGLSMRTMRDEWSLMKSDLSNITHELRASKEKLDQVTVLQRDRDSAFRRIDELRASIKKIRDRQHWYVNKLGVIYGHLNALGRQIETPPSDFPAWGDDE